MRSAPLPTPFMGVHATCFTVLTFSGSPFGSEATRVNLLRFLTPLFIHANDRLRRLGILLLRFLVGTSALAADGLAGSLALLTLLDALLRPLGLRVML